MVDNLEKILPLLVFESDDDFYYLQILQRKKENPHLGSNSRVIKNYYIYSTEYLIEKYDEIKRLCEVFNARASIRLNKRSAEKVAFKTLSNISNTILNKAYNFVSKSYDRACGLGHNDKNKKWILDLDFIPYGAEHLDINDFITEIEPKGNKLITVIESKSGVHMIVKPFNLQSFNKKYPHIEIHKDNPTNLYIH